MPRSLGRSQPRNPRTIIKNNKKIAEIFNEMEVIHESPLVSVKKLTNTALCATRGRQKHWPRTRSDMQTTLRTLNQP